MSSTLFRRPRRIPLILGSTSKTPTSNWDPTILLFFPLSLPFFSSPFFSPPFYAQELVPKEASSASPLFLPLGLPALVFILCLQLGLFELSCTQPNSINASGKSCSGVVSTHLYLQRCVCVCACVCAAQRFPCLSLMPRCNWNKVSTTPPCCRDVQPGSNGFICDMYRGCKNMIMVKFEPLSSSLRVHYDCVTSAFAAASPLIVVK